MPPRYTRYSREGPTGVRISQPVYCDPSPQQSGGGGGGSAFVVFLGAGIGLAVVLWMSRPARPAGYDYNQSQRAPYQGYAAPTPAIPPPPALPPNAPPGQYLQWNGAQWQLVPGQQQANGVEQPRS
eukprot:TRINITY_DN36061_c0_g1_i1.p2 TRINITY_DN36061_c0_g1~~TRINITY_DN36061_c0_g1_i1.p2  ORF type:complete len:126 (+),score=3.09 TRINITY_DN36061_c0_g1_i1:139-516(+)